MDFVPLLSIDKVGKSVVLVCMVLKLIFPVLPSTSSCILPSASLFLIVFSNFV